MRTRNRTASGVAALAPPWVVLVLLGSVLPGCGPGGPGTMPAVEVHFSPRGGCTEAIVGELDAARQSVLVQAYSFTSAPIAQALVKAHQRGVRVEVILDKSQKTEKYSSADFLAHAGIPTCLDEHHAIAHNKIMIVDGQVVLTGSFNFTKSAEEHNAENLLVLRDVALAARYTSNWKAHAEHASPYSGRGSQPQRPQTPTAPPAPDAEDLSTSGDADPADEYVTSANSEVFHKRTCRSAAKIAPQNRITFATRGEAISAGRRPCSECVP